LTQEPIRRSITVHRARDDAFRVFTDDIAAWWPANRALGWGEMVEWEPPERFVRQWRVGDGEAMTEVEVRFEVVSPVLTTVVLEHRGWEQVRNPHRHSEHEAMWPGLMAAFATAASDPDCQRAFARQTNQATWALLAGQDRAPADDDAMVAAAYASFHHWAAVGGPLEAARAHWLVSHVHAVLGPDHGPLARHHAERSLATCLEHGFGDFDLAYGHEAVARAAAAAGDERAALAAYSAAVEAAAGITDPEDRALFDDDLAAGPWYGLSSSLSPSPPSAG